MKVIDIGIAPISKREMIFFDWYYFDELNGKPGKYAWRLAPHRMLMGAQKVNIDLIDDDLKPLHKLMTKASWRKTLPSCSGHFLTLDEIWSGYQDLVDALKTQPDMKLRSARTDKEYRWNIPTWLNIPPSYAQFDFDLVEDAKTGLYGWIALDSHDVLQFRQLEREVKKYGYDQFVDFEMVGCKGENALLIITHPPDAETKKNLWEAIYEIARKVY